MNRLSKDRQARIINLLVEGMSMRAITRIEGVGINTVARLIDAAGSAAAAYHDEHVRHIKGHRTVECDEVWAFVYAKEKNVPKAISAPENAGDAWTFSAIDADSKLVVSYLVGDRDGQCALELMDDLRSRLESRPQITTDGLGSYVGAVEGAFGGDVDFAQLIKQYGNSEGQGSEKRYSPAKCTGIRKKIIEGDPDFGRISTSYIERSNLTLRMGNRRFTRLTNAFSKKIEKHSAMVNLFFLHYNFCRVHKTLKVTPAMAAGIETTVRDTRWIAELVSARTPKPKRPEMYRKRK